jgi:hypothetical protein
MVDDAYTVVLLHFDGADTSTTITDESGKSWSVGGNAQIDTAQSKFGGASLLLDGNGDYITTVAHADLNVGSGNYTIDCWIRRNSSGVTYDLICGQRPVADTYTDMSHVIELTNANKLNGGFLASSSEYKTAGTGTITADNTWHHIALVRNGNTLTSYIDGVADGTKDVTGLTANSSVSNFSIGRMGMKDVADNYFDGWIDEFRFSKGIARWTANFTPPTSAYAPPFTGGQAVWFFMKKTKTLWDLDKNIYRPRNTGLITI